MTDMLDVRIDGGRIVRPIGEPRVESIGIRDGRIAAVGALGDLAARQVIDVAGAAVLPGIIDTHFHIGFTSPDREWTSESHAAALGGVTTMLVYFRDPGSYEMLLPPVLRHAERNTFVDFAIHLGILNDGHLDRLERFVELFGIRSIKMYTTYKSGELSKFGVIGQSDGFIYDTLVKTARMGRLTVNVHCENDDMAERGRARWSKPGLTDVEQWSNVRPVVGEVEAIRRVALLARDARARLFIPHVSSGRALEAALAERAQGTAIMVETSPHYLIADRIAGAGVLAKVNPPVRGAADARRLCAAVRDGEVDAVGSDHAAFMRVDKEVGDVLQARPGFPGVGTLLPILLDCVSRGLFPLRAIARLQQSAAQIFGIPEKGELRPGNDADLVVVDPGVTRRVNSAMLGGISDFTPYEGLELTGWPVMTFVRGHLVAREGQLEAQPIGRYVRSHK